MGDGAELDRLFAGPVVPEATPSPRTIRFATPPIGDGPSRAYDAAGAEGDARVARVFAASDEVTNVLVGPAFVAVTILHADHWEALLAPLLDAVTEGFAGGTSAPEPTSEVPAVLTLTAAGVGESASPRRVERAWSELGGVRADSGEGLDRIAAAARDEEPARRQVAAVLLGDADPTSAARHWIRLLGDPVRSVRRAVVDTVADAGRADLRPLLEQALTDSDAWVRWRALRGLAVIGIEESRSAIAPLASDPDFRVRLESTRVLGAV